MQGSFSWPFSPPCSPSSLTHAAPIPTHVPFTEYDTNPISAVGRLFISFPLPENKACTATALISKNQSVVDTAAHCFFDNKGNLAEPHNIQFCPQYHQQQMPLGCWRGQQLFVSEAYKSNVAAVNDFALLVVKLQPDKTTLQSKVRNAAQPLPQSLSFPAQEPVTVYGYPGGSPPYTGEELFSLSGTIQANNSSDRILEGSYLRMPGGDMAPGSSGGPWFARINTVIYLVGHLATGTGSSGLSPNFRTRGWYALFDQAEKVITTV